MSTETTHKTLRVLLSVTAFILLSVAVVTILIPFWKPIVWGVIIVTSTWPLNLRVRKILKSRSLSSLIMTVGFAALFLAIVVPAITSIVNEMQGAIDSLKGLSTTAPEFLQRIKEVPIVGEFLFDKIEHTDITSIEQAAQSHGQNLLVILSSAAKGVAGAVFTWIFTLLTMFFLYRDGQTLISQFSMALSKVVGVQFQNIFNALRTTIRGAVYGLLVTALAQGILAGFSYIISGAPLPYFLGFITMLASLLPFGTPFVYVPVAAWLILSGNIAWGIFVLVWGIAVVSMADNILRPIFISQATSLPVLLILMGVLGGIISFGIIGVFVGPVIIAVTLVMWNEFVRSEDS